MSSVQHSHGNNGEAESTQQSNSEAKVMRERARYYSMSPDQMETLRQNKRNYYLKKKKNAGASGTRSVQTESTQSHLACASEKIIHASSGIFDILCILVFPIPMLYFTYEFCTEGDGTMITQHTAVPLTQLSVVENPELGTFINTRIQHYPYQFIDYGKC